MLATASVAVTQMNVHSALMVAPRIQIVPTLMDRSHAHAVLVGHG